MRGICLAGELLACQEGLYPMQLRRRSLQIRRTRL